ncbi:MAG: CBS and ACT domain-containing protein [Sporomusaceae bacterium]|nr:CBS and ACT domain-containing protein [Sporomusaceae bacterium]
MFVANRMTKDPVTVAPDIPVLEAKELLKTHKFRRLPVVRDGKLVGIVTDRDLRAASASPATTLSVHELNYLLAKMKVSDIMKKNVLTIAADATIEEAALVMYREKIGGLIVVDEQKAPIGIITETDIFKCFVDVMGLNEGKTRLTIGVPDQIGVLHQITGVFSELGINIGSLALLAGQGVKSEMIIRADIDDLPLLTKKLGEKGYPVLHVAQIG